MSKYGAPSQSIYGEKATAAAALASATHSAAAGAISLASGLAKIGANFSSTNAQQPQNPQNATTAKSTVQNRNNPQSPDQQNEEMYDMFERANMYDDASSKSHFIFKDYFDTLHTVKNHHFLF